MTRKAVTLSLLVLMLALPAVARGIGGRDRSYQERFTILVADDSDGRGLFPLWQKLFTAGYEFEMVGPHQSRCRIGNLCFCRISDHQESSIDSLLRKYPADVVLLNTENVTPEKICAINPEARVIVARTDESDPEKMAQLWFDRLAGVLNPARQSFHPEIVAYKTLPGGDSLCLHIFRPDRVRRPRPALIYFFGGGWSNGTPVQFYRECAYYASQGIVAVSADYRIAYTHHSTPLESVEDARDAILWLRRNAEELGIDPGRIAVSGGSAGGHLAATLGTVGTTDESAAAYCPDLMVLNYPVVDKPLRGFPSVSSRNDEIAPLYHVSRNTPPTLFLVGTKDHYVPVEVAGAFRDSLESKGVECRLEFFEGAGHPIFLYRQPLNENFYRVRELTDGFLIRHGYMKKRRSGLR